MRRERFTAIHYKKLTTIVTCFIILIILLSNMSLTKGSTSTSIFVTSTGTIVYSPSNPLMNGVGHPAWSYDRNGQPVNIQALVTLAATSGANCWREAMYVDSSIAGYYTNLKNYCDQAGLKFIIQTLAASVDAMTYEEETAIIQNINGAQTQWINSWGDKIQQLHPYAIMVINEPTNDGTFSQATSTQFNYYRQFCINCINAWRSIQPDLVIIVQNNPFNDFFDSTSYGFAANPLPFSDILYSRHIYYAYGDIYPPSYLPEQQAYWNADTDEELAQAKQKLQSFMIKESCQTLINKDEKIMFDEWGSSVNSPNAQNFTRDFIDLCKQMSIGQIYYDIVPPSYECTGLLNEDYLTLNAMGKVWDSCLN